MKDSMKRRNRILTVVCLLAAVGAWLFWQHDRSKTAASGNNGAAPTVAAAKNTAAPAAKGSTTASSSKFPTLNTNKLAFRLSNTTNSLHQLEANPHAILLANAFIDTDKPLDLKIPSHLKSSGDPGAYIVQARGSTDARFRATLEAAGAQVVSYIPNNAYLVNLSASAAGALASSGQVQAVLPYEPYYKIQSSLLGVAVNDQALPAGTALNLGIFAADEATAEQMIEDAGAKIIGHDRSAFGLVLRVLVPTDWTTLVQLDAVQFVEPTRARVVANDLSRVTVGISPDTVSGMTNDYLGLNGNNVLVAVNDTGVDTAHPDFSVVGSAASPGSVPPSRVSGLTPLDLVDPSGHGTFVAGIIAGNGSESYTLDTPPNSEPEGSVTNADFRGKAPLAYLFSLNDSSYSDYQLQTNAAMVGALISNNSWDYGNGDPEYDLAASSYDAATRDAMPYTTGSQPVLFVFAAGNSGGGSDDGTGGSADTILSPGTAKNVITVGALEQ
jgi:subtilisin family serine protease